MKERLNVLSLAVFALVFSAYAVFWLPESQLRLIENVWGALVKPSVDDEYAVFVGDIMLARDVERKVGAWQIDPFQFVRPVFAESRAVIGNFEAAIPVEHVPTPDGQMVFSVKEDMLDLLVRAGITHLSLANNHSLDHGMAGLGNTVKTIEEAGMTTFGRQHETSPAVSLAYFTLNGQTVSVVGLNLVGYDISTTTVAEVMTAAADSSQWQIAYLHWGEEYKESHSKAQEKFAKLLVDNGADAIIGNHPHVVQDISIYEGVPVFYSLGNFVFDQYFSKEVQQGLMLKLSIINDELKFDLLPVTSLGSPVQPRLLIDAEQAAFLADHNIDLDVLVSK